MHRYARVIKVFAVIMREEAELQVTLPEAKITWNFRSNLSKFSIFWTILPSAEPTHHTQATPTTPHTPDNLTLNLNPNLLNITNPCALCRRQKSPKFFGQIQAISPYSGQFCLRRHAKNNHLILLSKFNQHLSIFWTILPYRASPLKLNLITIIQTLI